jgi:sn-glycerol 3-phosphate transport system substrate-binding protein
MSRRNSVWLAAAMLIAAGCGSGESIISAGNDPVPTTPVVTASTQPGDTTPVVTTAPPTTQPQLLDTLPPCRPAALDEAAAAGPVEITFWHGLANELGRELTRLTDEYNAAQNRVRVTLEFQGGYDQTVDKYLQSNVDNRPDLVQAPEYYVQLMVDTESTVPMQACVEADQYDISALLPAALNYYATEGVQWAMPFNVSNPVLYYNKKVFREAGLDDSVPPRTLAEVAAFGRQIVESGAASYGLSIDSAPDGGGGWALEQWMAKEGEFYSDNSNGRLAPSERVLFDGPTGVRLMTELRDIVTNGAGFYVGENPSGQDNLLKLADGAQPATMTIATSAALGPLLGFVANGIIPGVGVDDIGVGPMPSPNGAEGSLVGGAALWIVADKGDAKSAAAWDYVKYITSAESQSAWAAATGYVPIRTDAVDLEPLLTTYATDPRFKVAFDQLLAAPDSLTYSGPVLGPLREVRVTAAAAMAEILEGADPQTALSAAAEQANAQIADYNRRR